MDETQARRLAGAARILGARTAEQITAVLRASPVGHDLSPQELDDVLRAARERVCEG
jgi:hypothetical protein